MGYNRNHAIVVTSWKEDSIIAAHTRAVEQFADIAPVSPLTDEVTNGYRSFFVAPDGSKEGWAPSDRGDKAREQYIDWLRHQAYDDGSSALDWVEVDFGGDDRDILHVRDADGFVRRWEGRDGQMQSSAGNVDAKNENEAPK